MPSFVGITVKAIWTFDEYLSEKIHKGFERSGGVWVVIDTNETCWHGSQMIATPQPSVGDTLYDYSEIRITEPSPVPEWESIRQFVFVEKMAGHPDYGRVDYLFASGSGKKAIVCECGGDVCNAGHSTWCPKYNVNSY